LNVGEPSHGKRWNERGEESKKNNLALKALQVNETEKMGGGSFPGRQEILRSLRGNRSTMRELYQKGAGMKTEKIPMVVSLLSFGENTEWSSFFVYRFKEAF
jgi:hypothetical protein